jgi:Cys-rich four helix bundle protein (predicted Tat secretion target)
MNKLNKDTRRTNQVQDLSKRKLLHVAGAASAAGVLMAATPLVASAHNHKSDKASKKMDMAKGLVVHKHQALLDVTSDCVQNGHICIDHCVGLLAEDDTSIADCIKTIRAMLPALDALKTLASAKNPHLAAQAKVCISLCDDCRIACEKHAHHHAECKQCMLSCEACIEECKKVI